MAVRDGIVQGLCFIVMKVTGVGYPALSHYRGDCKHCYGGRPEVCVEVHGSVTAGQ